MFQEELKQIIVPKNTNMSLTDFAWKLHKLARKFFAWARGNYVIFEVNFPPRPVGAYAGEFGLNFYYFYPLHIYQHFRTYSSLQLGAIYIYFAPKNCKKITDFFPTKFLIL
jgi:hypothetical protein